MIDIVCTLGPASSKPEVIRQLLEQGMTVARVNLSHSDQRTHRDVIHTVREVARSIGKHVSILGDLQGPKIRLGEMFAQQVVGEQPFDLADILQLLSGKVPSARNGRNTVR
ncbi:hypothetical protein G3578_11360 [Brevibacillus sp. SYP-B805]|uniref:pyruvate kinase n=1 Tax=Brevibacillus sp. SYP-B805 TaxID=1578199 RepID=UPI0013EA1266|nr:pyruvate kinase [Brevibacillus sp. SYP-B805]NGQ95752.1 hypothetical protein [Brevibacillus sp. SYP-B805]